MRFWALLFLCGCGRTEPIEGFSAELTPTVTSDAGVTSACRRSCPGLPPGLLTPLTTGPRGVVLHWPHCEGCLRVTWRQGLESYPIKLASTAWDISLAGGLCLEMIGDAVDGLPTDARQTIHFMRGEVDTITQDLDPTTGALKSVTVATPPPLDNARAAFLLGRALGLERSSNAKNSVMSYPNSDRDSPGTDDQTSLRALYGPPQAWCR